MGTDTQPVTLHRPVVLHAVLYLVDFSTDFLRQQGYQGRMSSNCLLCKSWRHLKELGISLLLVAITVGIIVGFGLCTRAPKVAEISPSIEGSDLEMTVTNNDAFDWTNVQLELNSAFRYGIAAIHAGEALHIQLQDFVKPDGTNFDPLRQTPSQLAISCETPQGEAQWIGSMSQPR